MTQSAIHTAVHLFAPWQSLYSNSKVVAGTVTFLHLVGLLFGGGFAVAADRATWRAIKADPTVQAHALQELRDVHTPVLAGLALLIASGLLMAAADVETFGTSIIFWVKMGLIVLLGINGLVLKRTETALRASPKQATDATPARKSSPTQTPASPRTPVHVPLAEPSRLHLWRRLRMVAVASLTLWTTIMLAGTILLSS